MQTSSSVAATSPTGIPLADATSSSRYWLLCALLVALASLPVVIGLYPPFIDYPFHLARIDLLSRWSTSDFVREHYEIASLWLPNLSLEMTMLPLARLLPSQWAGVVFICMTFALLLSGTAALHRALFGTHSAWALVASGWLYNWIIFYGFMNYVFGVGIMLWCLAAWIRLSSRAWQARLIAGCALALAVFFCHLLAFFLYTALVAGYELQRAIVRWRTERRLGGSDLVVAAAQFVIPFVVYLAISPVRSATTHRFIYDLGAKFASPIVTLTSGNLIVDLITLVLLTIGAIMVVRSAKVELASQFIGPLIGLAVLFLMAPLTVTRPGPAYVDVRIPMAALFVLIAATRITFKSDQTARLAAGVFAVYLLIKIAVLSVAAAQYRQLVHEHFAAFERIEPQSTLFAVRQRVDDTWFRRFYIDRLVSPRHIDALAAMQRDVFVPALYTVPGGQPIRVRAKFRALKKAQGDQPVEVRNERELAQTLADFAQLQRAASPHRSAYVLMQDRAAPLAFPPGVEEIASGPGFRLVRIVRGQPD